MEATPFSVDMFRQETGSPPLVYAIGPSGRAKTLLCSRLLGAGWELWKPHSFDVQQLQTFMTVPAAANQYFILFKGSTDYPCSMHRLPAFVKPYVDTLAAEHDAVLYDSDRKKLYAVGF